MQNRDQRINSNIKTAVSAVATLAVLSSFCTAVSLHLGKFSAADIKKHSLDSAQSSLVLGSVTAAILLTIAPQTFNRYNEHRMFILAAGIFLSYGYQLGEFNPLHNISLSQEEYQNERTKGLEIKACLLLGTLITGYLVSSISRDFSERSFNNFYNFWSSSAVTAENSHIAGEATVTATPIVDAHASSPSSDDLPVAITI